MNESEEIGQLPADIAALLEGARADVAAPQPSARERVWERLEASLPAGGPGGGSGGSGGPVPAVAAEAGRQLSAGWLVAAAAVVAVGGFFALRGDATPTTPTTEQAPALVEPVEGPAAEAPSAAVVEDEEEVNAESEVVAAAVSPSSPSFEPSAAPPPPPSNTSTGIDFGALIATVEVPRAAAPALALGGVAPATVSKPVVASPRARKRRAARDDLGAERRLLAKAKASLRAGDAALALRRLKRHRRRFPRGTLTEERSALEVVALGRDGQDASARRAATAFGKRYPKSIYQPVVRAALDRVSPRPLRQKF